MHSIPIEDFSFARANIYYFKLTNELNKELVKNHYWKCGLQRCPQPFNDKYLSVSILLFELLNFI